MRTTALALFAATILMVAYSLASLFLPGAELIPARLGAAAHQTLHPASASVWLRERRP
ncbi:MAG: hypothetical protein ACR2GO_04270 [Candidatus Limnocylindria bacterium]